MIPSSFDIARTKNGWGGRFDEIRIWNTFRTNAEILQYYGASLTGNETGLLAYYDFDDDSQNPVFFDVSPNGRYITPIFLSHILYRDGTLFGSSFSFVDHIWDYYSTPQSYSGCCLPLTTEVKSIPAVSHLIQQILTFRLDPSALPLVLSMPHLESPLSSNLKFSALSATEPCQLPAVFL